MELIDPKDYSLKKIDNTVSQYLAHVPESDKVFVKLLPYSEYVALASKSGKNVLVHYYGNSGLRDRIIETNFSHIADLKVGKVEKLIYVVDKGHGILAEYLV